MKFFRSRTPVPPPVSRSESLACVPKIFPVVSWHIQDSGEVLLEYPLPVSPLLAAIFARFNRNTKASLTKKLQLDNLGSQVWLLINGKNSVGDIIRLFAERSAITHQEAEQAVTAFLRELGRRGLILLH